jgi:nicotinamide-nucleotide amidase
MKATTLSVGDELLIGQIDDTNARWIAERLAEEGVFRVEHRTIGDDRLRISAAIRELAAVSELVVITGGLGPTLDDLTREALNDCCNPGTSLVEDAQARATLDRWFRGRGRKMPESNLIQALRPSNGRCLDNPNGTAPGLVADVDSTRVFCLPGPPREMRPMFEADVVPYVRGRAGDVAMPTISVHSFGMGESALAERLGERMLRTADPMVGTNASNSIVIARIRAHGPRGEAMAQEVERLWSPYAFGREGTSLAMATIALLRERGHTLALAESCTGGLIGAQLTEVAGASEVVLGGFIVYSNEMKVREVQVNRSTLAAHGAVSEEVARQLALGARERTRSTWGIGVTGIAGPGGGTAAKPVGTVFVGLAGPGLGTGHEPGTPGAASHTDGERVRRFQFPGERNVVRDRAAKSALQWLRLVMLGEPDAPLLWAFADAPAVERESPSR